MVAKKRRSAETERARAAKRLKIAATKPKPKPKPEPVERRKTGGRVAGTPNKATVTKEELLQAALNDAFEDMSEEALKAIVKKPLEVLELLLYGALKARSFVLARGLAQDILPYREAKLVAPPHAADPDAPPIVFEIRGGLPQKAV